MGRIHQHCLMNSSWTISARTLRCGLGYSGCKQYILLRICTRARLTDCRTADWKTKSKELCLQLDPPNGKSPRGLSEHEYQGIELTCIASRFQRDIIASLLWYTSENGRNLTNVMLAFYHCTNVDISLMFCDSAWISLNCELPVMTHQMSYEQATNALQHAENGLQNSYLEAIFYAPTLSLEEESCLSMQDPTWWSVPEVSAPHFVQKLHHRQWELVAFHIFGLGPFEVNPNQTTPPLPHSIACSHKLDLRKCLPKQLLSPVPREVSKPTSELSIPALLTNIYCSVEPLQKLKEQYNKQVEVLNGDLADLSIGQKAVDLALKSFGRLDGMVLNHGVLGQVGKIAQADPEQWKHGFDIKAGLPALRETKGKLVFTSSGAAVSAYRGWGLYGATKAAMNHLALSLGEEEPDVTTISIRPGMVDTEMQRELREDHATTLEPQVHSKFTTVHKEGKLLKPEQPGHVMAKLVLDGPKELSGKFLS
ncbi:unnamed protein product [Aspergillus oryzae]|nr:unnamed protein product [Aspergillus oryzae]